MPYDEELADRLRNLLDGEPTVREQRMFGGLAFLVGGNFCICASHDGGLLCRVDPEDTEDYVALPHAWQMEMRGRAMKGWIRVAGEGVAEDEELRSWLDRGLAYAKSLPPK